MSHESLKNLARVRQLFMREWDPIGVVGEPAARDEYDRYSIKAYAMLIEEQATTEAIAAYLLNIVIRDMGLSHTAAQAEACARAAKKLVAMRSEFEAN